MSVLMCVDALLRMNLLGKVFLVTGGNAGIGVETVKQLAKQGGTVVFTSRNLVAGKAVEDQINSGLTLGNKVEAMQMDLTDLSTVQKFAADFKEKYTSLHCLINNAGVMNTPALTKTKDNFEMQFGTNHVGHFVLTNLLLDVLKESKPSRVVCVSSCFHYEGMGKPGVIDFEDINFEKRKYDGWTSYAQSKLANVLHAKELAKRLEGTGVTAVSLHPGWVRTNLIKNSVPLWVQNWLLYPLFRLGGMIEPWAGIQTALFCALDESVPAHAGEYYSQAGIYGKLGTRSGWPMASPSKEVTDENAARLWAKCAELLDGKVDAAAAGK